MQMSYAKSIPVTFTKLTGHTGGSQKITGVYRADLSGLPLTRLRSITITDNSNGLGGLGGKYTGFDLDSIMLSNILVTTASGVQSLSTLPLFDFSPVGTIFDPGRQRPPTSPKLFGTDVTGIYVDNTVARLGSFDGKATAFLLIPDRKGFVSMGDHGVLSFNLKTSVSLDSLFLYIGELGDNGEVAAGSILISDTPVEAVPKKKSMSPSSEIDTSQSGPVYATNSSRLFHRLKCGKLISNTKNLIKFSSHEDAVIDGGKPCSECNP